MTIEDYGDEVHLKLDQRLPWTVALQILQAIKGPGPHADSPVSPQGAPIVRREPPYPELGFAVPALAEKARGENERDAAGAV